MFHFIDLDKVIYIYDHIIRCIQMFDLAYDLITDQIRWTH